MYCDSLRTCVSLVSSTFDANIDKYILLKMTEIHILGVANPFLDSDYLWSVRRAYHIQSNQKYVDSMTCTIFWSRETIPTYHDEADFIWQCINRWISDVHSLSFLWWQMKNLEAIEKVEKLMFRVARKVADHNEKVEHSSSIWKGSNSILTGWTASI